MSWWESTSDVLHNADGQVNTGNSPGTYGIKLTVLEVVARGSTAAKETWSNVLETRGQAMSHPTLQFESLLKCTLGWGMHSLSPLLYASGALAWNNLVTARVERRLIGRFMSWTKGSIHKRSLRATDECMIPAYVARAWCAGGIYSISLMVRFRGSQSRQCDHNFGLLIVESGCEFSLCPLYFLVTVKRLTKKEESYNHDKMLVLL